MLRLWLTLLLLLAPRPGLAMAQDGAPSHGETVLAGDAPEAEALQAANGYECFRSADPRQGAPLSSQNSYLRSRGAFRLPAVLSLAGAEQRPHVDAVSPLCERLPYQSNAPPHAADAFAPSAVLTIPAP